MTRPQIIRADTLDLQDHHAPSAQDHTQQPTHPAPLGVGPPAPHQDASIRHAEEERAAEQEYLADAWSSGRSSHEGSDLLDDGLRSSMEDGGQDHETRLDEAAVQQNGGEDSEMIESEGDGGVDESLDDADKISSSPSIDDGGYISASTVFHDKRDRPTSSTLASSGNSASLALPPSEGHHLHGGYITSATGKNDAQLNRTAYREIRDPDCDDAIAANAVYTFGSNASFDDGHRRWLEGDGTHHSYTPLHDILLDNYLKDRPPSPTDSSSSWVSDSEDETEDASDEDDDTHDSLPFDESRFVDSGWGGECLHEIEDIDFEFVYALHTFVATVEGQANATKGDTMVLLDDTNSYWWLVRVVKDSSIGYLPAEHIETPTERLARLNKHRNIDLSAAMLGDNPEKSKNPLKIAMRRRNAKIVHFTTPTYFEPNDVDWSEGEDEADEQNEMEEQGDNQQNGQEDRGETIQTETIQTNGHVQDVGSKENEVHENGTVEHDGRYADEDEASVDDMSEYQAPTVRQSRNGTMRNTDSFFKDDTAEPRKISLTPNLLRDDSKEQGPSTQDVFDQVEKVATGSEKSKEDRKKREKKSGMLSGLFKKKEKRIKVDEAAGGTVAKVDSETGSPLLSPGASPDDSGQVSPTAAQSPTSTAPDLKPAVKRQTSGAKLTKAPPQTRASKSHSMEGSRGAQISRSMVRSPTDASLDALPLAQTGEEGASEKNGSASSITSWTNSKLQPQPRAADIPARSNSTNAARDSYEPPVQLQSTTTFDAARSLSPQKRDDANALYESHEEATEDRVSPMHSEGDANQSNGTEGPAQQPKSQQSLVIDTSQTNARSTSPISPASPFETEMDDTPTDGEPKSSTEISSHSVATAPDSLATPTASSPATTPAPGTPPQADANDSPWQDSSLRAYLDNHGQNDVKELLLLVRDKTGVVPVSHDHPLMKDLGFQEHRKQLDDMSIRLDGLLNGFLARKAASRSKVTPTR